jgi:GDPmannose 4,6-dehydratase
VTRSALITGVTGQDGAYLAKFLIEKQYNVFGLYRRTSSPNFWRLQALDIYDRVGLIPGDVTDMASLLEALSVSRPDEVYNLAAQSFVGASFEKPLLTADVDGLTSTRILESIRRICPSTRFYQASTSEVYGNVRAANFPINELTVKQPVSPYAAAKLHSHHITQIYRDAYGIFAVNGILFNHESPLRGLEFVTRKVSNGVARIALGMDQELNLGNLNSSRDWGFAPEYVAAMWLMLQQDHPDDYVIATGESHSVRELVELAFNCVGLDWQEYVKVDSTLLRPAEVNQLVGDASKARRILGWQVNTGFEELITNMVEADLSRWKRNLKGEVFPWDAPNHPPDGYLIRRKVVS